MDIEDLRIFVEVADASGVSPAARRLGVAKSIVSRSLLRLESALGAQLLSRNTRGAALTEAGTVFRDHAAKICAELDLAREAIAPTGELRGRLRVAAPLTFGGTVAPVLVEMARRYPKLDIQSCYTDRFVDIIAEGYDCAIRVGYLQASNLVARRVGSVAGALVASPAYIAAHGAPRVPDEILEHQALMQGSESWSFMKGEETITVRPQGRFKADNGAALLAAATAGLGIAWLPHGIIHELVRSGALVRVMTDYPVPVAGAFVVRPPGQHPPRKIRILTEMMVEHCETLSAAWLQDESPPKKPAPRAARPRPRAR